MLLRSLIICFVAALCAGHAQADTLDSVKQRGYLKCAVRAGHVGFASPDVYGEWRGFDADFCRAVAAAVLGDSARVMFISVNRAQDIDSVATGSADLAAREPQQLSANNRSARGIGVLLHDSYGFLTQHSTSALSALGEATLCVLQDNGSEEVINAHVADMASGLKPSPTDSLRKARERYQSGACQAIAGLRSDLAGIRTRLRDPAAHRLLDIELGKAPTGPRVRSDDEHWAKVVQWVLFALIEAEELGITSANALQQRAAPRSQRVAQLLGTSGELGAGLNLGNDWALRIIEQVGNYGELYARNLGPGTPFALPRTRNKLWTQGGALFAPPLLAR